ncbi:cell wall-active antibiotics response protein LiaF [Peribacillus tepidiphilus]|uniref:cell wall-active antibiotics response protein LiaF n=1 Tax=Peribacillus tepidiphilus TaxID=2652445 RepID=UPI0035B5179B
MYKSKTDMMSWILIIGVILLLLEVTFFNGGLIFSLLFSGVLIYFGKKRWNKTFGKILFWIGIISALVTVLNMMTFKFFLIAILIFIVIQFSQSKKNPILFQPDFEKDTTFVREQILKKPLIFRNMLFGRQKTPEEVYEWQDVNIQVGVGDTIVDLSNTMLPKGESVICVRNILGSVQVLVPYDLEVRVVHSTLVGSAVIFQMQEPQILNQALQFETAGYETADQKIKIVTSMVVGSLEVKRI